VADGPVMATASGVALAWMAIMSDRVVKCVMVISR